VLDLDGREVHSAIRGDRLCVTRGTVRAFLSPKPQWMAASRKKRAFPDRVALWRASQIGPRTTFNFEKGYGGSEVTPSTGSQARRTK
jgi:hypothetical protein